MAELVEVTARLGDTILDSWLVSDRFTVGSGPGVDLVVAAPIASFALIERGQVATAPWFDDEITDRDDTTIRIELVTITIRRSAAVAPVARAPTVDQRLATYVAASLVAHVLLWITATSHPPLGTRHGRGATNIVVHTPGHAPAVGPADAIERDAPGRTTMMLDGDTAPRAWDAGPGAAGTDAIHPISDSRTSGGTSGSPTQREHAIATARHAGVLGSEALERGVGEFVASQDLASGFDGGAVYDDRDGSSTGFAGSRRSRTGCIEEPCGIIGTGRYATLCGPNDTGDCGRGGSGYGAGGGGMHGRIAAVPTVTICASVAHPCGVAIGELDKAIIRRHIRRKLPAITGCYERELLTDAQLAGAVQTSFVIATDGTVQSASASGVSDGVASCVATVLSTIQFPRARNGVTEVHYPFTFRVAG